MIVSGALAFAGLLALAAGMTRHRPQLLGQSERRVRDGRWPGLGAALLILSLVAALGDARPGHAVLLWIGLLALAAALVTGALALPRGTRLASAAGFAGTLLVAAFART